MSQRPIIVIGSGGHAKVLIDLLLAASRKVLFCTDHSQSRHGTHLLGVSVAGPDELILDHSPQEVELVNGIGSVGAAQLRRKIYDTWVSREYQFATAVHPSAYVSPWATISQGAQIMAHAVVQPDAVIGNNTIINTAATVDHDCQIGSHCHIAPGCTLSGSVRTGDECHLGVGATIIQQVKLGDHVIVGAGATVIGDVPDNQTVVGTPAKTIGS